MVTSASNAVITLALFSLVLITFLVADRPRADARQLALYVVYQVLFFAMVAGFSLAASVLFMRYRDLNQVWEVVTHAGFFVAPIIYPARNPAGARPRAICTPGRRRRSSCSREACSSTGASRHRSRMCCCSRRRVVILGAAR